MAESKREPYRDKRYAEIKREAPSLSDDEVLAAICDELDDQRAELLAALQPFADLDDAGLRDDVTIPRPILVGWIRRARATLAKAGG